MAPLGRKIEGERGAIISGTIAALQQSVRLTGCSSRLLKRVPINLMHSRSLSALMVRSRNLGSTWIPQPRARRLEPWGPPHPSRRALRNDCVSRKRTYLRPPQDEADKRPAPLSSRFIFSGTRFSCRLTLCSTISRPRELSACRAPTISGNRSGVPLPCLIANPIVSRRPLRVRTRLRSIVFVHCSRACRRRMD